MLTPPKILITNNETTPLITNNNNWRTTIKNWINFSLQQTKYVLLTGAWLELATLFIAILNIIGTVINSNNPINWLLTWKMLWTLPIQLNAFSSLFVSYYKRKLTTCAGNNIKQTIFYQQWRQLLHKCCHVPINAENLTLAMMKNQINIIEHEKIPMLQEQMQKFQTLLPSIITIFETFFKTNTISNIWPITYPYYQHQYVINNNIITNNYLINTITNNNDYDDSLVITCDNYYNIDNSTSKSYCDTCYQYVTLLAKELIKIAATITTFTVGVAFTSTINIVKTTIANDLPLNTNQIITTFLNPNSIILAFSSLIIFKLKFHLIDNGLTNLQQIKWWQWLSLQLDNITNKLKLCLTITTANEDHDTLVATLSHYQNNYQAVNQYLAQIIKMLNLDDSNFQQPQARNVPITWQQQILKAMKEVKYLFVGSSAWIASATLDSLSWIISAQISIKKPVNFWKDLQLLISKNNIIAGVISQIGFSLKTAVTNYCWDAFKTTYTYQFGNYLCHLPQNLMTKCYQWLPIINSNNAIDSNNNEISNNSLVIMINNLDQLITENNNYLTTINDYFANKITLQNLNSKSNFAPPFSVLEAADIININNGDIATILTKLEKGKKIRSLGIN